MEIHIAHAVLGDLAVDAVVLPCHSEGSLTATVRDLLVGHGAEAFEKDLRAKAPLAIGAAILGDASALKADNAILVPISKDRGSPIATELVRRAIKAALTAARIKGYKVLAIPSILTQDAAITVAEAARAVAQEIHIYTGAIPESIYMAAPDERLVRIFEDAVEHAQHASRSL